ncbi:hypothetical protein FKM82_030661 [Ascaphus truei]
MVRDDQHVAYSLAIRLNAQKVHTHKVHGARTFQMAHEGCSGRQGLALYTPGTVATVAFNGLPHFGPEKEISNQPKGLFYPKMSMIIM